MSDDAHSLSRLAVPTADGLSLRAELSTPSTPLARVVLCHPHPLHGGSMYAGIVDHLFRHLPDLGLAVLRFNFRGVQGSDGRHDAGGGERLDVAAAVDRMSVDGDGPVHLVGWSFGADMALGVDHARVASWTAIAPTLRTLHATDLVAGPDPRPILVLVPEHDQFTPPDQVRAATASWTATDVMVLDGTDHFLGGAERRITDELSARFLDRV